MFCNRTLFASAKVKETVNPKNESWDSVPRASSLLQNKLSIQGSLGTCCALPSWNPIHRVNSVM